MRGGGYHRRPEVRQMAPGPEARWMTARRRAPDRRQSDAVSRWVPWGRPATSCARSRQRMPRRAPEAFEDVSCGLVESVWARPVQHLTSRWGGIARALTIVSACTADGSSV